MHIKYCKTNKIIAAKINKYKTYINIIKKNTEKFQYGPDELCWYVLLL